MSLLSSNRKGSIVGDSMSGISFLFVFFIVSIIAYLILKTFTDVFASTVFADATTDLVSAKFLSAIAVFDYLAVLLVVVLIIGVGYSSYRVASSPIAFVVVFIVSPVLGLMSYSLSYIFSVYVSNSVFSSIIYVFPRTVMIGQNFHWVMLAFIVVGSVTFFAKRRGGQDGAEV